MFTPTQALYRLAQWTLIVGTVSLSTAPSTLAITSAASEAGGSAIQGRFERCAAATSISGGQIVRGSQVEEGVPVCFRIWVPESFALAIEVTSWDEVLPRLSAQADGCVGTEIPGSPALVRSRQVDSKQVVTATATAAYVSASGSEVLACAGAQSPFEQLQDFRLSSAFVQQPSSGLFNIDDGGDPPIWVDPETLQGEHMPSKVSDDGGDPPIWVDPETLRGERMIASCVGRDDHADVRYCASSVSVGDELFGNLESTDDLDYFELELDELQTVRIDGIFDGVLESAVEAQGDSEHGLQAKAVGGFVLMDSDGHALAGPNDLLIRTLEAGRYFLRIEGEPSAYGLAVSPVSLGW